MAYLRPKTLTCPNCGKSGQVDFVIGIGPQTKPGDGPSYEQVRKTTMWNIETQEIKPGWQGKISCPDCDAIVLEKP